MNRQMCQNVFYLCVLVSWLHILGSYSERSASSSNFWWVPVGGRRHISFQESPERGVELMPRFESDGPVRIGSRVSVSANSAVFRCAVRWLKGFLVLLERLAFSLILLALDRDPLGSAGSLFALVAFAEGSSGEGGQVREPVQVWVRLHRVHQSCVCFSRHLERARDVVFVWRVRHSRRRSSSVARQFSRSQSLELVDADLLKGMVPRRATA